MIIHLHFFLPAWWLSINSWNPFAIVWNCNCLKCNDFIFIYLFSSEIPTNRAVLFLMLAFAVIPTIIFKYVLLHTLNYLVLKPFLFWHVTFDIIRDFLTMMHLLWLLQCIVNCFRWTVSHATFRCSPHSMIW